MKKFIFALALAIASVAHAQLSNLWKPTAQVLIVGEQHSVRAMGAIVFQNLDALQAAGMKHLAVEVPQYNQGALDKFAKDNKSIDWLAKTLWETAADALPIGYQMKLEILDWARKNHVRVWAVDSDRDMNHRIASLHYIAMHGGIPSFSSPDEEQMLQSRGLHSGYENLTAEEANRLGWKLFTNGRTEIMAKNIAKIVASHPQDRVVAICGNLHADLAPYRAIARFNGFDLSTVANDSIESYLPEALRTKTQTVSLQGGFSYEGSTDRLAKAPDLTEVERYIASKKLTDQTVYLAEVDGYSAIDSVIFLPLVHTTTVAQQGR